MEKEYHRPRRRSFLFKVLVVLIIVALIGAITSFIQYRDMADNAHRRIAVARLEGPIENPEALGTWLDTVRDDPYIRAVLLRIDSPGGSVTASQELFAKVRLLSQYKRVVVSMGDTAASGGYYAALGADVIVANPSTITGSIGVKMILPNFTELMNKIGISEVAVTSGAMKDAGSPFREISPEERAYFDSIVQDLYDQFVHDVAVTRDMPEADVRRLADGRAYTGRQAFDLGLVDELGTFDDALEILCSLADIHEPILVEAPEPDEPLRDAVLRHLTGSSRAALPSVLSRPFASGGSPVFLYLY